MSTKTEQTSNETAHNYAIKNFIDGNLQTINLLDGSKYTTLVKEFFSVNNGELFITWVWDESNKKSISF